MEGEKGSRALPRLRRSLRRLSKAGSTGFKNTEPLSSRSQWSGWNHCRFSLCMGIPEAVLCLEDFRKMAHGFLGL